jgi:hypothetical protein
MVVKNANLEKLTEEENYGQTSRDDQGMRGKAPNSRKTSVEHYSDEEFQNDANQDQNYKSFGAPATQDLNQRIDSSDQDENASYEELNEEDLKTHSSKEDEEYSEEEEDDKLNMKDIERMQ